MKKKKKKRQRALDTHQELGQADVETSDGEQTAHLIRALATELCSFQDECRFSERVLQRWHGLLETLPEPTDVPTTHLWLEGVRRIRAQRGRVQENGG